MTAFVSARWSDVGWRARRPWVRRRLRQALADHAAEPAIRVWDLARAAGVEDIPSGELQAVVSDLVDAGLAEGLRGPRGWWYVRAAGPIAALESADTDDDLEWVETREYARTGGGSGWMMAPAAWTGQGATRSFSVTARVPRRQSGGLTPGVLLFALAAAAAAAAVLAVLRTWPESAAPAALARADWYTQVSRTYVDNHLAGKPGFAWPYKFAEVGGVREDASPAILQRGMAQYLRAALFTGYPSYMGILAWARKEFGDLPAGAAGDAWIHRAAETYATRSLEGAVGYDLTPALLTIGDITPGERDQAAVTEGLERALRGALFLGTPESGGLLDWARRTIGDVPAR